jgi:hypothetical protein
MKRADYAALTFAEHPHNPLVRPPFPSPILADPTFVPPGESPDGRWHLFAHSLFGIHHFTSADGLHWQRHERICGNALRACLLHHGDDYFLFYEKCRLMLPILPGQSWASHIEVRHSKDLRHFGEPQVVLRPTLPWHHEPGRGSAVGNPCVIATPGGFRMYFSAGLVYLPDCGFCEPRSIGVAEAALPTGPFLPKPLPILTEQGTAPQQIGAGAIKVLPAADGLVGFQNAILWDSVSKQSHSAIWLLGAAADSEDSFTPLRSAPIVAPTSGWKQSHVYGLDARWVGEKLWIFFNARNHSHWMRGREAIGLVQASQPAVR